MFERVEFLLRTQDAFQAGDPVREEDAARFNHAIDALLTDDDANLVKLLGLNKKRISIAEENRLYIRASLILNFYSDNLASIGPFPASFEIADNLALLTLDKCFIAEKPINTAI